MSCKGCHEHVTSDGHGELIHVDTAKYGCEPGKKGGDYPVAR
jgi:hypothetical protein